MNRRYFNSSWQPQILRPQRSLESSGLRPAYLADCLHKFQGGIIEWQVRPRELRELWRGVETRAAIPGHFLLDFLSDSAMGRQSNQNIIKKICSILVDTAERFSASDVCSHGGVVRMWVRILSSTVVLVSFSKTLCCTLLLSQVQIPL